MFGGSVEEFILHKGKVLEADIQLPFQLLTVPGNSVQEINSVSLFTIEFTIEFIYS